MPANRKTADRRQQQGAGRRDVGLVAVTGGTVEVPAGDKEWLAGTAERWDAYWRSNVAKVAERETDLPAITRLFGYYDELERSQRALRKQRFVAGSTGQMRLNPAAKYISELEGHIRQLEDRFGLTPMARLKLGVEFGNAHRSLDEMNRSFDADPDEEEDPRLQVVEATGRPRAGA